MSVCTLSWSRIEQYPFFPPLSAVKFIKMGPVCLCVSPLANTLIDKPPNIQTKNLMEGMTLTVSQLSFKGKVARLKKCDFQMGRNVQIHFVISYAVM